MAKDPAFPFYPSDFLTGTVFMSDAQVGKYIRLMCLQHQHGHLTEKQMLSVMRKMDTDVMDKFLQDENGLYYNERLEKEIEKRREFCQKQRENISKRWNKSGIYVGNTTVLPLENDNDNRDIRDKDKGVIGGKEKSKFDAFWKAYPRKVGKEAARKAFTKVKVGLPVLLSAVEAQKKSEQWTKNNGQFIPNPATWLNQGRWEDETEPSGFVYNDYYEEGESL